MTRRSCIASIWACFWAIVVGAGSPATAADIYVDGNPAVPGPRNGSDWEHAYEFLQDAFDKPPQPFDAIRVADGTYYPDDDDDMPFSEHTPGDRNDSFMLIDTVDLFGGYPGFGAPDPDARDPAVFVTILSGDISIPGLATDNSLSVVRAPSSVSDLTEVDGVTIRDGFGGADDLLERGGAGVALESGADPTFINCIIRNNVVLGGVGGGFYASGGNECLIQNCQFIANESGDGGAIKADGTTPPAALRFEDCLFQDNHVTAHGGGAVALKENAHADFFDTDFVGNLADQAATGGGGGLFVCLGSSAELRRCHFQDNEVNVGNSKGGAIATDGAAQGVSSVIVISSTFVDNRCLTTFPKGGAIYLGGGRSQYAYLADHQLCLPGQSGGVY